MNCRLRPLGDLKRKVDPGLLIDNIAVHLYILISEILIECRNGGHALAQQLVAKLASGERKPVLLYGDLSDQHGPVEVLVTPEIDSLDPMTPASLDLVNQLDVRILVSEIWGHFHIEVSVALK